MAIRLERYESCAEKEKVWDEFVRNSRNGTFLMERRYMEYHASRFEDCSLMAFREGKLCAIICANRDGDAFVSHGGLTYGGWILPPRHFDGSDMLELMEALAYYCREEGMRKIIYKPLPWIYARQPSQEDIYAIFRLGGRLTECNLSTAIRLADNPGFSTLQRRNLRRGEERGYGMLNVEFGMLNEGLEIFYRMLEECLRKRHDARPVHTLEELRILMERFPDNIRLHLAVDKPGNAGGGVIIFDTPTTAHCQYIVSTEEGRKNGALALLFDALIRDTYAHKEYFDFGTSNEEHGLRLNAGLLHQKYGLGGRGVAYEKYEIEL